MALRESRVHPAAQGSSGDAWLSQLDRTPGIQWAEARDAAKHATRHGTASQSQESSDQNGSNVAAEKPGSSSANPS